MTASPPLAALPPLAMLLWCPECSARHIDVGEFATKIHHTHACQSCGHVWRPAIEPTVGVQFLPGFKNATELSAHREPAPGARGLLNKDTGLGVGHGSSPIYEYQNSLGSGSTTTPPATPTVVCYKCRQPLPREAACFVGDKYFHMECPAPPATTAAEWDATSWLEHGYGDDFWRDRQYSDHDMLAIAQAAHAQGRIEGIPEISEAEIVAAGIAYIGKERWAAADNYEDKRAWKLVIREGLIRALEASRTHLSGGGA